MIDRNASVMVTGGRGMVGSAIVWRLAGEGFAEILSPTREQLDLRNPHAVDRWFDEHRPRYVFHAAGTVGGLGDNLARPAVFWSDNLLMTAAVLEAACTSGVEKLLYLGSSCIYPRDCPQPMREEMLLGGPLEPSNQAYAVAKISGVIGCQSYRAQFGNNFISALPCNLYGPGDHFEPHRSHVAAALVRKFHDARESGDKSVVIWGTGQPRRELLHVDDAADACLHLMDHYEDPLPINVGSGEDLSIKQLAELVRELIHPSARLEFDVSRPDGVPRKLLDTRRLSELGWRPQTGLREGLASAYQWFLEQQAPAL
ncbi:MAG: GDP-L-fucose synthase [Planctomycetales bacterium]|nr:GDP-L-fucose synthase [Planctomycetales bacterium]